MRIQRKLSGYFLTFWPVEGLNVCGSSIYYFGCWFECVFVSDKLMALIKMLHQQHNQFGHVFLQLLGNEATPDKRGEEEATRLEKDEKNTFPILIPHTNKIENKQKQQYVLFVNSIF